MAIRSHRVSGNGDHDVFGDGTVVILATPGHTPGSQCFLVGGHLVSGDTLFLDGCGRTDLPGSDAEAMYDSLQRLAKLPADTIVYPLSGEADAITYFGAGSKVHRAVRRFSQACSLAAP